MNVVDLAGEHLRRRRFWVGEPMWHADCDGCRGRDHVYVYKGWLKRTIAMLKLSDMPVALLLPGSQSRVLELRIYPSFLGLYWDLGQECVAGEDLCEWVMEFDLANPGSLENLADHLRKLL